MALSYFVLRQLDSNYEQKAASPQLDNVKGRFYEAYAERTTSVEKLPERREH